jgi:hypothetical protein
MTRSKSGMKVIIMLGLILCMIFCACKKKEIQGPKGEPGDPGGGGNALSTSVLFSVSTTQWKEDTVADCLKVTLDFPQITKEVLSAGSVKVFIQQDASFLDPAWTELPFVRGDLFTQFGFDEGHLYLEFVNIEGGITGPPATNNYRAVILTTAN